MTLQPVKVIGGVFPLDRSVGTRDEKPAFLEGDCHLLVNARCGLRLLVETLEPAMLWLPSYYCDSMLGVAAGSSTSSRLYSVDDRLRPQMDSDTWDEVRPGDLFVVVDYFGYVTGDHLADEARLRGAVVVEDAALALLSPAAGRLGDYVLWSPRKFAGLPDGGVLQARRRELPEFELAEPTASWWQDAYDACERRAVFEAGGPRYFLDVHQRSEDRHPQQPTAMSPFSRDRISRLDWTGFARRRGANHSILQRRLETLALLPAPGADVVPFGYSIRVSNRDEVRAALFAEEIYPSVLWPAGGGVPPSYSTSHRLASEIMTIPCDQRYGLADMNRIADIVVEVGRR